MLSVYCSTMAKTRLGEVFNPTSKRSDRLIERWSTRRELPSDEAATGERLRRKT
jgi:hypothetical protein